MNNLVKLNLGAGNDIREGYINHDIVQLQKIDVVHDLNVYPWPFDTCSCDEIIMKDVLEHLDNFVKALEELHRVLKPGGKVYISVPYWNSANAYIDPTHKRGFHEHTFRFFDPSQSHCMERPYYSKARFNIEDETFVISPFVPYVQIPLLKLVRIKNKLLKRLVGLVGNIFSNVILDLEIVLRKVE